MSVISNNQPMRGGFFHSLWYTDLNVVEKTEKDAHIYRIEKIKAKGICAMIARIVVGIATLYGLLGYRKFVRQGLLSESKSCIGVNKEAQLTDVKQVAKILREKITFKVDQNQQNYSEEIQSRFSLRRARQAIDYNMTLNDLESTIEEMKNTREADGTVCDFTAHTILLCFHHKRMQKSKEPQRDSQQVANKLTNAKEVADKLRDNIVFTVLSNQQGDFESSQNTLSFTIANKMVNNRMTSEDLKNVNFCHGTDMQSYETVDVFVDQVIQRKNNQKIG
jgi:hypothetical protein